MAVYVLTKRFRAVNKVEEEITVNFGEFSFLNNVTDYLEADMAFQAGEFSRWSLHQKSSYVTAHIIGMAPSKFIFADINACLEYAEENEQVIDIAYYREWLNNGVSYLNIDSNNRTINLLAFVNDEFPLLPGEYRVDEWFGEIVKGKNDLYSTLPEAIRKRFDESTISVTKYVDVSREELSDLFININDGKPLNDPEKRNAKTSAIAKVIRELATSYFTRFVGDDVKWIGTKEANRRYVDDFIAGLSFIYFYGLDKTISPDALWEMYDHTSTASKNASTFKKVFTEFMTFANDDELKSIPNKNSILDLFVIFVENKKNNLVPIEKKKSEFIRKYIDICGKLVSDLSTGYDGTDVGANWTTLKNFETLVAGRQSANNRMRNKLINKKMKMNTFFKKVVLKPRAATLNTKFGAAVKSGWKTPEGKDIDRSKLNDGKTYHSGHDHTPHADGGGNKIDNIKVQEAKDNLKLGRKPIPNKEKNAA